MDKRSFMKFALATAASPFWSRFLGWAQDQKLTNWAGNLEYDTERLYQAATVQDVQRFVKTTDHFKVLGTRHCFNDIANTDQQFLSLRSQDKVVELDRKAQKVTIEAGMSYGQLCPYLDQHGFALHNLASLPHISVAGACTTATHGSGVKNQNLSTQVSALELVTATGDVLTLSRDKDGETFRGAVVGLGALGVITKVTLDLQPSFTMKQYVYENVSLEQLCQHFDVIEGSAYSVSLFTDWQKQRVNEIWLKVRNDANPGFEAKPEFFGGKLAARNLHPIAELSAENCTEQMGVAGPWYARLPHFRMGFTPSAGKELQSEYFVPRKHAVEAILAVERLRDKVGPHLLISEIRTIAADDFWMSTAYKRDSVAIHFTWKQDWPAVHQLLPEIERELAPFDPRPHWGKLFTMAPTQLRSRYERLPDFVALAGKLDPKGKFRNKFLERNIFS
ncbi:MAG TPA: D-arabinono-1,4-lactone oxidase [Candidatus Sulfotelmatobacter sp.]|nr:D-arabinono-1,4-lactone oxidase [Candidatus Sulfotelmatobacter sp.]